MSMTARLASLRALMQAKQLDFYFVPSRDQHNNEYVPACWQRRAFISGFTGSAGDALIGLQHAYLWTDPRYFLQAEQQLDPECVTLMKVDVQGSTPAIDAWLAAQHKPLTCAVDPCLMSIRQANQWQQALANNGGQLLAVNENLIDQIWHEQPAIPHTPLSHYAIEFSGQSCQNKLLQLRQIMQQQQADALVITMLDAIAWLFNIRGKDIDYNPVSISYAIVYQRQALLFIEPTKVDTTLADHLNQQGVSLLPYQQFIPHLRQLSGRVWVDPTTCSWSVQQALTDATLILQQSPISHMKAVKNAVEQQGMRDAHHMDAIAVVKFLCWLTTNWQNQTELSAAQQLDAFRLANPHCQDLSFSTISGFADNGAVIHYCVTAQTDQAIDQSNLYLVDSGGQYLAGTTDITRTIHLGTPSAVQKRHYTLVLKGHLALRHAVFPHGTCGEHLDSLARQFLWQDGLNYGHGTGHGVGCHLCVHEGPQRISPGASGVPLLPGMVVSNEPGVYLQNHYGIRIENLCLIEPSISVSQSATGDGPFYRLSDLTKVPYANNLIDTSLLSPAELTSINHYHSQIYALLKDHLTREEQQWLAQATAPLSFASSHNNVTAVNKRQS